MIADKDHLNLPVEHINAEAFSRRTGHGGAPNIPNRNRREHADKLQHQLACIKNEVGDNVLCALRFKGAVDSDLLFEDLNKAGFSMELLSINKAENGAMVANVRINSAKTFTKLSEALERYVNPPARRGKITENPMPYIASIEQIDLVKLEDFFTDAPELLPQDNQLYWWEIWLTNTGDNVIDNFKEMARAQNLTINNTPYQFEDRTIFLCQATKQTLQRIIPICNLIAEVRLAKPLEKILAHESYTEQQEVLERMISNTIYNENPTSKVVVLDGNTIVSHPLIGPALKDNHRARPDLAPEHSEEHATEMAGLALFGNLKREIAEEKFFIPHMVEGVQIFDETTKPGEYGLLTENAFDLTNDTLNSAYIMPVTDTDDKHKGKPSIWSSYIDKIAFTNKKLVAVSVGNLPKHIVDNDILIVEKVKNTDYEEYQKNGCIENPAQAWNVLSVGAFTEICNPNASSINGNIPYANPGELSPFSRTSYLFESQWPIKPEILFEGGNMAIDIHDDVVHDSSFSLTSCNPDWRTDTPFTTVNATSAATGLAGKFLGELLSKYPDYWPETIRGLTIHSAEWTDAMKDKLPTNITKAEQGLWLRLYGYGVPNLNRAMYSASNALTLVVQKDFQVFEQKFKNGLPAEGKTAQLVLIPLPWPTELLQDELGTKKIKIKVTLSYFVKPNPSSRGYGSKYAYQSHNLKFDLQRPTETKEQFEHRINKLANDDNEISVTNQDSLNWLYGVNLRSKGSVHKDILEVTGADLANMKYLAVYSTNGWWKNSKKISPKDTRSRFSLIIDIDAGEIDVDLYNLIKNEIQLLIPSEVMVDVQN